MIVKLTPASENRRVWMVSIPHDAKTATPGDFMTVAEEQRSFIGDGEGYFDAEPAAEGWELKSRVAAPAR
jgi:hypothetical protein